jgi:hypothetical protein
MCRKKAAPACVSSGLKSDQRTGSKSLMLPRRRMIEASL